MCFSGTIVVVVLPERCLPDQPKADFEEARKHKVIGGGQPLAAEQPQSRHDLKMYIGTQKYSLSIYIWYLCSKLHASRGIIKLCKP